MIYLDMRNFPVKANLHAALQSLRLRDKPRTLWINALCINQTNNEEHNAQVRRMKDIYSSAFRVLVFLGPAVDDSDIAMDLISGDSEAGSEEAEVPQAFDLDPGREVIQLPADEVANADCEGMVFSSTELAAQHGDSSQIITLSSASDE